MALNIYLIRHGKTHWNLEGRLQGSADTDLAEEGILGAKEVGKALQAVKFTTCYSSMLKRAQDTANYILGENHQPDVPHFHHKGLNELDFGSWEGTKSVDLYDNEEYWQMKQRPAEYKAISNQGETVEALYQRVMKVFEQIVSLHREGENVLIVAHGMTLTMLTAILKGVHWHDFRNEEKHRFVMNTAINVVEVKNGKAELVKFNEIGHLSE